jgi:D-alanine-D-alanine ligase-like ATP-grasp enzyme
VAQGGTMEIVKRKDVPKSVGPIIKRVQDVFRFYDPKIYTIDIIFDRQQNPWVVELNTMPGMYFYESQKKQMDRFYLGIIRAINKACKK